MTKNEDIPEWIVYGIAVLIMVFGALVLIAGIMATCHEREIIQRRSEAHIGG
jgi:hypothetical protein